MVRKKVLRILFIPEEYPSGLSGSSFNTRPTIEFLLERGHNVDVACIKFQGSAINPLKHSRLRIFWIHKLANRKINIGMVWRLIQRTISFKPTYVARMYDARLQTLVDILIYSERYDYVFFEGYTSLQYAKSKSEKNIYVDREDIASLMWSRYLVSTNILLKLFYLTEYIRCLLYEKRYLPFVRQILSISPQTKKHLQKIASATVSIMPTVVSSVENAFHLTSRNIVFTGTLSWPENKNGLLWFLENCWREILQARPQTKLLVSGQAIEKGFKKNLARYPNVECVGFVKNLRELYAHAGVAISPIFINQGIKVKILTYMNYGLPVIATKQSVAGLTFDGGIIIATQNDFAKKTLSILSNDKLRISLSNACRGNIQKYYTVEVMERFFTKKAKIFL